MLDDGRGSVVPTIEHDAEPSVGNQPWVNNIPFSPKRRRLDEGDTILSPTRPTFKHPEVPASELSRAIPLQAQFQRDSTQASTDSDAASQQRPEFLRPST